MEADEFLEVALDCDLGAGWVEGLFRINSVSAYLSLQSGLHEVTIQARIMQAAGLCQRPPKSGEKVIVMDGNLYVVDDLAILAIRRVVFDFITPKGIEHIVNAWRGEPSADPYRTAYGELEDEHIHHYVVMAVLDELQSRGELPVHPSHDYGA